MTPPNIAHIGETHPRDVFARSVSTPSGSTSSSFAPAGAAALSSFATATTAAASASSPGFGSSPPFDAANFSSAANPRCNAGDRSSLEKSDKRNSPGSAIASFSVLNFSVFVSFTCVAIPPPVYAPYDVVSSSSWNECALTFFIFRGFPSLSSVIPLTSVKITDCPSWSSTRSSSTHVTIGVASLLTLATMHVCGSSPSVSAT
mmetsp:Transcript_892/g.2932  ORF Transcript_892/g.2932 Transcript_892/m.2932 type:complete len:203 (-) Transcript_892:641-1249(-)